MHIKNWPFLNKGGGLLEIFIQKPIWKPVRGVYFVLKLNSCPKVQHMHGENCPHFALCAQWNILKFAHYAPPLLDQFEKNWVI